MPPLPARAIALLCWLLLPVMWAMAAVGALVKAVRELRG